MNSEKSLTLHLLNQSRRDAVELARRKHIIDRLGRRVARLKNRVEEVRDAWLQQHRADLLAEQEKYDRLLNKFRVQEEAIRVLKGGKSPWYVEVGDQEETPQDKSTPPTPYAEQGQAPETQPRAANDLEMPF